MSLNPAAKTTSNSCKAVSAHKITKNYSSTNPLPQLLHLLRVRLRWRAEVELSVFGVELFVFKLHSAGSSGGLCLQPQGLAVTNGQLAFSRSGSSTPSPWPGKVQIPFASTRARGALPQSRDSQPMPMVQPAEVPRQEPQDSNIQLARSLV